MGLDGSGVRFDKATGKAGNGGVVESPGQLLAGNSRALRELEKCRICLWATGSKTLEVEAFDQVRETELGGRAKSSRWHGPASQGFQCRHNSDISGLDESFV